MYIPIHTFFNFIFWLMCVRLSASDKWNYQVLTCVGTLQNTSGHKRCPGRIVHSSGLKETSEGEKLEFNSTGGDVCEQVCYRLSWCKYTIYNVAKKKCVLLQKAEKDKNHASMTKIAGIWSCCTSSKHHCVQYRTRDAGFWITYPYAAVENALQVMYTRNMSFEACRVSCLKHIFCRSFTFTNLREKSVPKHGICSLHFHEENNFSAKISSSKDVTYEWHICRRSQDALPPVKCKQRPGHCHGYWSPVADVKVYSNRTVSHFYSLSSSQCLLSCFRHINCSEVLFSATHGLCQLQATHSMMFLEYKDSLVYIKGGLLENLYENVTKHLPEKWTYSWRWKCCKKSRNKGAEQQRRCACATDTVDAKRNECGKVGKNIGKIAKGTAFWIYNITKTTEVDTLSYANVTYRREHFFVETKKFQTCSSKMCEQFDADINMTGKCTYNRNKRFFVTRQEWGALPATEPTTLNLPITQVVISNTVIPAGIGTVKQECADRVRKLQKFFQYYRGWSDVAYNFMVCDDGRVYEGRGWFHQGAHQWPHNSVTFSVCFLGWYETQPTTRAAIEALGRLLECGKQAGYLTSNYTIRAHRDVGDSLAPGRILYDVVKTWPRYIHPTNQLSRYHKLGTMECIELCMFRCYIIPIMMTLVALSVILITVFCTKSAVMKYVCNEVDNIIIELVSSHKNPALCAMDEIHNKKSNFILRNRVFFKSSSVDLKDIPTSQAVFCSKLCSSSCKLCHRYIEDAVIVNYHSNVKRLQQKCQLLSCPVPTTFVIIRDVSSWESVLRVYIIHYNNAIYSFLKDLLFYYCLLYHQKEKNGTHIKKPVIGQHKLIDQYNELTLFMQLPETNIRNSSFNHFDFSM